MKSVYIVWLVSTGLAVSVAQNFGNPFGGGEAEYRIEYAGKAGTTLWGNYIITEHDQSRSNTTEKVIGELPQTVNFTGKNNAIVSANGSTTSQEPVAIQIYKNGKQCGNSQGTDRAGITGTIVCR